MDSGRVRAKVKTGVRQSMTLAFCAVALGIRVSQVAVASDETFPHAPFAWGETRGELEFHVAGDTAIFTLRSADGSVAPIGAIEDVGDALGVLADERLAFAWPALLAWAGDDLTVLRDRAITRSKMATEAGLIAATPKGQSEQWSGDIGLSAFLRYARVLADSGFRDKATALRRQRLTETPVTTDTAYARQIITVSLAGSLFEEGDTASAIRLVEELIADKTMGAGEKLNLKVNLAQYLARSGAFQQALVLIEEAWQDYRGTKPQDEDSVVVPDSEAQFAWIKACALNGLGQHDRARQLIAGIAVTPNTTTEQSVTAGARMRGFRCMRDAPGLATELATQLADAPPASALFVSVQPDAQDFAPDRVVMAAALRQPDLAKAIKGRVHMLNGRLQSALTSWRGSTSQAVGT